MTSISFSARGGEFLHNDGNLERAGNLMQQKPGVRYYAHQFDGGVVNQRLHVLGVVLAGDQRKRAAGAAEHAWTANSEL